MSHSIKEALEALQQLNKKYVEWNLFQTQDGPQPNMRGGPITYNKHAFWKKDVSDEGVRLILELLLKHKTDFALKYMAFGYEHSRKWVYCIYYLPSQLLGEKEIVLALHEGTLSDTSKEVLRIAVSEKSNQDRLETYNHAVTKYPSRYFGPESKSEWVPSKKTITLGGVKRPTQVPIYTYPSFTT